MPSSALRSLRAVWEGTFAPALTRPGFANLIVIVVGWILQVVVALAAFFVPAILVIALIFGGMWAYATIKGASLDRRNARLARDAEASSPESSNGV